MKRCQCAYYVKTEFSNDAMKPSKMKDHLERVHFDETNKDIDYFKVLKEQFKNRPNFKTFFFFFFFLSPCQY